MDQAIAETAEATVESVEVLAEQLENSYSTDRYGNWKACIKALRRHGLNDREIEAVIRSKWTRWAADGGGKRYGHATAKDLLAFVQKQSQADLEDLVRQTFE